MLHAVVVGIDQYRDPDISNLSYACADAEAFGRLLNDGIHPSERSVRVILDAHATKRELMIAIGEDLARAASAEDIIVLFFAGHGSPETSSSPDEVSRYLIAHDSEFDNIYATGIDMQRELPRWFERICKPRLIVLFIDACFSGRAGGRTFEGPHLRRRRARLRTRGPISLANLELGEGRLMMAACDDDQVAREFPALGHGVFTYHLLQALKRKDGSKETIGLNTLYDDIAQNVRAHTHSRQIPVLNGRSVYARFPYLG
jgi:uncharacterized caspase-like protein